MTADARSITSRTGSVVVEGAFWAAGKLSIAVIS